MSSTNHRAAAAAVVVLLSLTATACNDDTSTQAAPSASPSAASSAAAKGKGLKDALKNLKNWKESDWAAFAQAHGIKPDVVKGFWDLGKMQQAQGVQRDGGDMHAAKTTSNGAVQAPAAIAAKAEPHPYSAGTAVAGKLFMQPDAQHLGECSATVVSDPAHPGKSNMIWTAGHCVHAGKGGDYFQKFTFVPAYNRSGAGSNGKKASYEQLAPLSSWTADYVLTSPQWEEEGGEQTGPADQFDFAVLRVKNDNGDSRSLEETVGGSVPIWFNAQDSQVTAVSSYGYPAAPPFDGNELEHCDSGVKPVRIAYDQAQPAEYVIGCTMTQGSSGGGWFANHNGKISLISVNSSGNTNPHTWMAGPALGDEAQQVFDAMSQYKG